jgi:hypothetical protein
VSWCFHPYNIMGPLGREILIDWIAASRGEPAADVCRSYVLLRHAVPEMASPYVDAYSYVGGISRAAILDRLPFVAAARLAEGVPEVDDLMKKMVDGYRVDVRSLRTTGWGAKTPFDLRSAQGDSRIRSKTKCTRCEEPTHSRLVSSA